MKQLRYNQRYQDLANRFAVKLGDGEWIGAQYMGHFHGITPPGGEAPNKLVFRPIWKDNEPRMLGVVQYILVENGEIALFSSIYDLMTLPRKAEMEGSYIEKIQFKPYL